VDSLRVKPGSDLGKLHPYSRILIKSPAGVPARGAIKEIEPAFRERVPIQERRSTPMGIVSLGGVP
jgi:hypothetical protein